MQSSTQPSPAPLASAAQIGVLLVNLGTPSAPTATAVRKYLAEFLSDPRVIDYPRWLWLPILYGIILRVRPSRSARLYSKIWTPRGSPLLVNSRALADAVAGASDANICIELAMRYGAPSIAVAMDRLDAAGIRRVLIVPLYPQYSATTTAAVFDAVHTAAARMRHVPELRTVADYHTAPRYIDALAGTVQNFWNANGRAEKLLLSFHGIPQRYVRSGDPYAEQCLETAALLRDRLMMNADELIVTFQSRVGREAWLAPYTDATLSQLPKQGVRRVQVLCPGFAVDCLETLEEIAIRGNEQFHAAGGQRLEYIPALNASTDHVQLMRSLIEQHTSGWT
jgi:protoporphyrin/coproporphyrin ferrochelatase